MADSNYHRDLVDLAKETCSLPPPLAYSEPYTGDWTFNQILLCVSGLLTAATLLFCVFNVIRHLNNFSRPNEQRQVVRIILTPLAFAICNFFSIWFYHAAAYIQPIAELYEAFPLIGIFLLFLAYIIGSDSEDPKTQHEYFSTLEGRTIRGKKQKHDRGSLRWLHVHWILIFQILPSRLCLTIATWITHATGCPLDNHPTAIRILSPVVMAMWVIGTLRFYARLRPELERRGAGMKFICFKLIVFLQIVQEPILTQLLDNGTMAPSSHISYEDYKYGLPAFIVCCEMFFFGIMFLWAFSATEYCYAGPDAEGAVPKKAQMSFGRAALHCLNVGDVLSGCLFQKNISAFRRGGIPTNLLERGHSQQEHLILTTRSCSPLPPVYRPEDYSRA